MMNEWNLFVIISIILIVLIGSNWILKKIYREPPKDDNCGSQADDNYIKEIKDFE